MNLNKVHWFQNNMWLFFLHTYTHTQNVRGEELRNSDTCTHRSKGKIHIIANYISHQFQVTADCENDSTYHSEWQCYGNNAVYWGQFCPQSPNFRFCVLCELASKHTHLSSTVSCIAEKEKYKNKQKNPPPTTKNHHHNNNKKEIQENRSEGQVQLFLWNLKSNNRKWVAGMVLYGDLVFLWRLFPINPSQQYADEPRAIGFVRYLNFPKELNTENT